MCGKPVFLFSLGQGASAKSNISESCHMKTGRGTTARLNVTLYRRLYHTPFSVRRRGTNGENVKYTRERCGTLV